MVAEEVHKAIAARDREAWEEEERTRAAQLQQQQQEAEAKEHARRMGLMKRHGIGSWEKHTKGFGMKMLSKMGYKPGGKVATGAGAPSFSPLSPNN